MLRKKAISLLGLASVIMLVAHLVPSVGLFLGLSAWSPFLGISGWAFFACFGAHLVLAIADVWGDWRRTRGQRTYPRLAAANTAQIWSGLGICLLTVAHVVTGQLSYQLKTYDASMAYLVANVLLFACLCVHLGVALPHVLVSLGMAGTAKSYHRVQVGAALVFAALFVLLVVSALVLTFGGHA